ncbi:MAG: hypothetical protein EB100_06170 [Crocinitomicaceae bacterium]|nr:hypothetical protein [Crocinitomicaceae bacterium]
MSLPILNVLENLGVPSVASEVLILNEPFDWSNTNEIISQIEDRLTFRTVDLTAKKKILKIVTEALDNVCKHAMSYPSQHVSSFICHLDMNDKLYISTRNLVPSLQVGTLIATIQDLNFSNQEELNQLYKDQLKHGKLSNEGDAGLGLIEIARKSTDNIKFTVEYHDIETSNFTFLITVDLKKY